MGYDHIGDRFGTLVVVSPGEHLSRSGERTWVCKCDCGVTKTLEGSKLRKGQKTCSHSCAARPRITGQPCSEDDCATPAYAKGLCPTCYDRKRRQRMGGCSIAGCSGAIRSHGLCCKHWDNRLPDNPEDVCSVEGCCVGYSIKTPVNLCRSHYSALRAAYGPRCSVEGCEQPVKCAEKCGTHYERERRVTVKCSIEGCETIAGDRFQGAKGKGFRHLCREHHLQFGDGRKLIRTKREVQEDIRAQVRLCHGCGERKPFSVFFNSQKSKDGKQSWCKDCANDMRYQKEFGITLKQRNDLEKRQRSRCAICKKKSTKTLHVDHCHATGTIRGLLCYNCNAGIGFLKDDTDVVRSALAYLNYPWEEMLPERRVSQD